jgi:hypothetical protein
VIIRAGWERGRLARKGLSITDASVVETLLRAGRPRSLQKPNGKSLAAAPRPKTYFIAWYYEIVVDM